MKIIATFANRTYAPDEIEMIHAWDEYSVDENPEGFRRDRQEAIDAMGTDLLNWVEVLIHIASTEEDTIRKALSRRVSIAPLEVKLA